MKKIVLSLAVLASVALVSCGGSDKKADSCSTACEENKEAVDPKTEAPVNNMPADDQNMPADDSAAAKTVDSVKTV